ncbi:MAG: MetS family NSS transporter small subunit [Candidatus Latescibacteria bacterium]|nr:MetS family NSS transporter small subunit [bacterium]MBD3423316.1 MetS family NSS transporter small subunit [Candidatus Latescibacterota bacterium]
MSRSAIIMMVTILSLVWGGFLAFLIIFMKRSGD